MCDLLIKNGKLVMPDEIILADVMITNGKFSSFSEPGHGEAAKDWIDAKGCYLFPGIIDCHVHFNEPGFEYREDFETGSRAAAAAGCTCVIEMPLNCDPPLTDSDSFREKLQKVGAHSYVDFALWGGLVGGPDPAGNIASMPQMREGGIRAFKGFTCPNGSLFPTVNMGHVRKALTAAKELDAVIGLHCEEYGQVLELEREAKEKKNRSRSEKISDFLAAHDKWTEYLAVVQAVSMAQATGGHVHICHVSHPMSAEIIKQAIAQGSPVTAETCPHYLGFTRELLYEKGVCAKCTPPLRERQDAEQLWQYVLDGTLSCIGSDHSPAADEEKSDELDIWSAWGGLNSVQLFLPMMFDMAVSQRGLSPCLLTRTMSEQPAKIFGLYGRKGAFRIGFDGDVVILDPNRVWTCRQEKLVTKGHISCFHGVRGTGAPVYTILRGRVIARDGDYLKEAVGYGSYLAL